LALGACLELADALARDAELPGQRLDVGDLIAIAHAAREEHRALPLAKYFVHQQHDALARLGVVQTQNDIVFRRSAVDGERIFQAAARAAFPGLRVQADRPAIDQVHTARD